MAIPTPQTPILRDVLQKAQSIKYFDYVCPHLTQVSFRMNAIVKNGPVVEPTNFELGIAGDRELENWMR
jgi:hypothetical protein